MARAVGKESDEENEDEVRTWTITVRLSRKVRRKSREKIWTKTIVPIKVIMGVVVTTWDGTNSSLTGTFKER